MASARRPTRRRIAATALLLSVVLQVPMARAAAPARPVVYEGTVAVAAEDDFLRGRATRRYFLDEQNLGDRVELGVMEAQGRTLTYTVQAEDGAGNVSGASPTAKVGKK